MAEAETTPEASDQNDDGRQEFQEALQKFYSQVEIGDGFLFFQDWPAWAIRLGQDKEGKDSRTVIPISKVFFGDDQGNVLLSRHLILSATIDLMERLSSLTLRELRRAKAMTGFEINIPSNKETVLKDLRLTQERVSKSIELLQSLQFSGEELDASADE